MKQSAIVIPGIPIMSIYADEHRAFQARFESTALADRLEKMIVKETLGDAERDFIESRSFFYLSTVTADGFPTVSFKGGAPGFVRVLDERTIAFPSYNGNGMFFSMGNIAARPEIGCLFMDFEAPHRIRFHGRATVSADDPLTATYPECELIVRVETHKLWVNCPRYIPKMPLAEASANVPGVLEKTPLADWKKLDVFQDVLPEADRERVEAEGGPIDTSGR